ncbi:uncharacterized protein TNCV_3400771 [Trichonephila clavipes]|nr:uncharacterized protein TNCV_3400771 [Trichonephila clavipes]
MAPDLAECLLATRGLLMTPFVISNHRQVTRMTPELAPSSSRDEISQNAELSIIPEKAFQECFRLWKECWAKRKPILIDFCGRGSLAVKVTNSWPACHEFQHSTAGNPPFRRAMHFKSVNAQTSRWRGVEVNTGDASSATRGLLATDHVILNHGQVTWTTPELAPPSPNYHTTPTGHVMLNHGQVMWTTLELPPPLLPSTPHQRVDVSALDRFNVHRCPTRLADTEYHMGERNVYCDLTPRWGESSSERCVNTSNFMI